MIVFPASGDFYQIEGVPNKVQTWIKYDIPSEYRYFSKEDTESLGYWYIHEKYLLGVIELAYKQTGVVDYSCLPGYLQIEIAREKEHWTVNKRKPLAFVKPVGLTDAYAELYLLPGAPAEVVHSVWKTLALVSHPDHGGDAATFRKYSEAYETIKREAK